MKNATLPKMLFFGLISSLFIGCNETPKEDSTITISGAITEDTRWTSDKLYVLDKQVTVTPGTTLTIEAGTVIKANPGEAPNVSMLVVARNAKIMAKGTPEQPIIFTSINDNVDPKTGTKSSLNQSDVGLWGGIILLGNAPVSLGNYDDETFYIGLEPNSDNSYYGGEDKDDNSGVMEYVSIRHGGVFIGTGSESNGLTLCGVGAKTTINQVEIFANQDDGIELFGGTVDVSNLIVYASSDDAIDIDEGYNGTISNYSITMVEDADNAIEINGGPGEDSGDFRLVNGRIDGSNLDKTLLYTIDEKAKGSITHLELVNVKEAEKAINSTAVIIEENASKEEKNSPDFSWTRSKEN
ncbi:MAG: hypothetical protein ACPG8F_09510 [Flavobacteriaceae bacterium]